MAQSPILSLLKADKEHANQSSPAAFEHLHGKSTEQLTPFVERSEKGAAIGAPACSISDNSCGARLRRALKQIRSLLARSS